MKTEFTGTAQFQHSDVTDTVLMFASHVGSFADMGLEGQLYAIGNVARVTFDGHPGYVDIDLSVLVAQAVLHFKDKLEVEHDADAVN